MNSKINVIFVSCIYAKYEFITLSFSLYLKKVSIASLSLGCRLPKLNNEETSYDASQSM